MGSYRLTVKADEDLAGLYRYGIQNFGLNRADLYYNGLLDHLKKIADNPLRFPKTEYRAGYRRSVHQRHSVYYRIMDSDDVEIVRILRGQNPKTEMQ